eukprot:488450-Amorphochlora_amoeboformis.AAC.1
MGEFSAASSLQSNAMSANPPDLVARFHTVSVSGPAAFYGNTDIDIRTTSPVFFPGFYLGRARFVVKHHLYGLVFDVDISAFLHFYDGFPSFLALQSRLFAPFNGGPPATSNNPLVGGHSLRHFQS